MADRKAKAGLSLLNSDWLLNSTATILHLQIILYLSKQHTAE
jgi:hypothetical protein